MSSSSLSPANMQGTVPALEQQQQRQQSFNNSNGNDETATAIIELQEMESSIRRQSEEVPFSLHAQELLNFCDSLAMFGQKAIEMGDFDGAEALMNRCELLTRRSIKSRLRHTDEDWLCLGHLEHPGRRPGMYLSPPEAQVEREIERVRKALHCQALHQIAFINKVKGHYDDAQMALQEAMAETIQPVRPQTLLNMLSIISLIEPIDITAILAYGSEAAFVLTEELEELLLPRLSSVLVNGTVTQRNDYMKQRIFSATMLVTAQLYQIEGVHKYLKLSDVFELMPPYQRILLVNRTTLEYSELQRLAVQELGKDNELTIKVEEAVADWSWWLGQLPGYATNQERLMEPWSVRWKYQVRKCRHFALLHPVRTLGHGDISSRRRDRGQANRNDASTANIRSSYNNTGREQEESSQNHPCLSFLYDYNPFRVGFMILLSSREESQRSPSNVDYYYTAGTASASTSSSLAPNTTATQPHSRSSSYSTERSALDHLARYTTAPGTHAPYSAVSSAVRSGSGQGSVPPQSYFYPPQQQQQPDYYAQVAPPPLLSARSYSGGSSGGSQSRAATSLSPIRSGSGGPPLAYPAPVAHVGDNRVHLLTKPRPSTPPTSNAHSTQQQANNTNRQQPPSSRDATPVQQSQPTQTPPQRHSNNAADTAASHHYVAERDDFAGRATGHKLLPPETSHRTAFANDNPANDSVLSVAESEPGRQSLVPPRGSKLSHQQLSPGHSPSPERHPQLIASGGPSANSSVENDHVSGEHYSGGGSTWMPQRRMRTTVPEGIKHAPGRHQDHNERSRRKGPPSSPPPPVLRNLVASGSQKIQSKK